MTQAVDAVSCAKGTISPETYQRLKGLLATLTFITAGARDLGGSTLWDALERLDEDCTDFGEKVGEETGYDP